MRRIILLFAVVILLNPILATAVVDNVIIGPYNVSFDIGQPRNEYDIQTTGPTEVEELSGVKRTDYTIMILGNFTALLKLKKTFARTMSIRIMEFPEEMTRIPGNALEENLRTRLASDETNTNIQTSTRMIDGVEGAVASYGIKQASYTNKYTNERKDFPPLNAYDAIYQPTFDDGMRGELLIYIYTIYPWDEGTRQLLNTIHVNKAKEPEYGILGAPKDTKSSTFPIQQVQPSPTWTAS